MDFSTFKPGQLACVTTLDAPVAVSAGAGSGKTFTLTQRIAWSLMEGSSPDGGRFLDGIDEVLAITFTEKAAAEIKARVKAVLRSEGMAEEALKVDAAWISTIHGMCSRILHSHAVQLGIDPSFGVLDEVRANELLDESIEEALAGSNEFVEPDGMSSLFSEYRARSRDAFDAGSVESMVRTLVRCASSNPDGFECFAEPLPSRPAGSILRVLYETIGEMRDMAQASKPGKARDSWLQKADSFMEEAQMAFDSRQVDAFALVGLLEKCPFPSAGFGTKDCKERAKEGQGKCVALAEEARYLLALPLLEHLMGLARVAYDGYRRRKREIRMMDNDDLLIEAAKALGRDDIAREFADKFKLVMVDEFQDTDQLQVDMIERLSGPGARRLCTVGDAQQSIYRFRGADVSVYKRRLDSVRASNPSGMITLPDNFRSHADILGFVDCVFGQAQVFGEEFMSLAASRREPTKTPFLGDRRIDVLLTTHPRSKGVGSEDARRIEASRIAKRLAELRDAGHKAGEMAVLLGRMSNAGVYADALRSEGFACVIAGGSVFASAPETRIMLRLAQVIANPRETSALFELLASDMFALSADDFIELSTEADGSTGVPRRRGLYDGIAALADGSETRGLMSPQLEHAVRIVRGLAYKAGRVPVARIMMETLRDSGWLSRLDARGAEGLSVAGNAMKAIRLVDDFEAEGALGPAGVAKALEAHLSIAKEAPGALSAKGGDFVSIMTVHASKGLEFPIVVVAEMERGRSRGGAGLSCETVEGRAYASLLPDRTLADRGGLWASKKVPEGYGVLPEYEGGATVDDVVNASDPLVRAYAVRSYAHAQEAEERRRLLYVAFTRAKEALIFAMTTTQKTSGFTSGADFGVYDDVRSALCGFDDFEPGDTLVDFGGSAPALVSRLDACEGDVAALFADGNAPSDGGDRDCSVDSSEACSERASFEIPEFRPAFDESLDEKPWRPDRIGITSYSALARCCESCIAAGETIPAQCADAVDEDGAFWDALGQSLSADADKATDVGTAFHLLAQRMVESLDADCGFEIPDIDSIDAVCVRCGLGAAEKGRILRALDRWHASSIAREILQCADVRAELPFFIELDFVEGGSPVFLEGAIDLFACDADGKGTAHIVDYKTGGSAEERQEDLLRKHELQAICYAYAALSRGFDAVHATFVRVEQPDSDDAAQPQCVRYRFDVSDVPTLEKRISCAYEGLA